MYDPASYIPKSKILCRRQQPPSILPGIVCRNTCHAEFMGGEISRSHPKMGACVGDNVLLYERSKVISLCIMQILVLRWCRIRDVVAGYTPVSYLYEFGSKQQQYPDWKVNSTDGFMPCLFWLGDSIVDASLPFKRRTRWGSTCNGRCRLVSFVSRNIGGKGQKW